MWKLPRSQAASLAEPYKLPLLTKALPTCKPPSWHQSSSVESEVAQVGSDSLAKLSLGQLLKSFDLELGSERVLPQVWSSAAISLVASAKQHGMLGQLDSALCRFSDAAGPLDATSMVALAFKAHSPMGLARAVRCPAKAKAHRAHKSNNQANGKQSI